MLIDVVLPFHKIDQFLRLAIESIFASDGVDVHLILLDDRQNVSIDGEELEFLLAFYRNKNISYYPTIKRGYANAINQSRLYLRSEYVALMNSDDLIHPKRFAIQLNILQKNQADLIISRIRKFNSFGFLPSLSGEIDYSSYHPSFLLLGAYGADATWFTKKDIFQQMKFPDIPLGADWIVAMQNFFKIKVFGVDKSLYFYRMHKTQVTQLNSNVDRCIQEIFKQWSSLNKQLNLPELNIDEFLIFAMPWVTQKNYTNVDKARLEIWKSAFVRQLPKKNQKNGKNLLKRRMIFFQHNSRDKINLFQITLYQLIAEFIWQKIFVGTARRGTRP